MAASNQQCSATSVRLDETNYPTWLYLMHHHIRGHGLLKFIDGSYPCPSQFHIADDGSLTPGNSEAYERWVQQDSILISMITNSLSAEALTLVIGCQTSMEVWSTLKQHYAANSEFHVMQLKSTMQSIRKGSDSIDQYLLRFKSVRDKLAAAGVTMNDQDVKYLILAGLPIEYGPTRQIIRGKHDITMNEVRSLLLSAEFEIELQNKALSLSSLTAMVAQNVMTVPQGYTCPNPVSNVGYHSAYSNAFLRNGSYSSNIAMNSLPQPALLINNSPLSNSSSSSYLPQPYNGYVQQNGNGRFSQPNNGFIRQNNGLQPTGISLHQPNGFSQQQNGGVFSQQEIGGFQQNNKPQQLGAFRMSSLGAGEAEYFSDGQIRRKEIISELPSLDKFLVKHITKLEKEVQETKKRRNDSKEGTVGNSNRIVNEKANSDKGKITSETVLGLGTVLLKHGSKFEKEIEEAKEKSRGDFETLRKKFERNKTSSEAIPSLESMLIKHSSKLEKEVEEAKKNFAGTSAIELNKDTAENMEKHASVAETNKKGGSKGAQGSLDKIMLKSVHKLEKEKMQALAKGNNYEYRTLEKKKEGNSVTLKEIETFLRQGTRQLLDTPPERPLLNCRQACCSMKLCQALPLIPPG